jgi:DNA-binding NarL/FixJ family response regulator
VRTRIGVYDAVETARAGLAALVRENGLEALPFPSPDARARHQHLVNGDVGGILGVVRSQADRELLLMLASHRAHTPVIGLLVEATAEDCARAVKDGIAAALPWESPADAIRATLTAVLAGCMVLPRAAARFALGTVTLTEQEIGWLHLLDQHAHVGEIAATAHCSTRTMHRHLEHLYEKLGATNRTDALERARRSRLL